jgi:ribosome maturation factor RimP
MLIEQLKSIIEPEIEGFGFTLWGIELGNHGISSSSTTLRIFVDRELGVSVDDCQNLSHVVSSVLDVENPIDGSYVLEISSPGVNRRIFTVNQARTLINSHVKVELFMSIHSNLRKFEGIIKKVENKMVTLNAEESEVSFEFSNVYEMRVVSRL